MFQEIKFYLQYVPSPKILSLYYIHVLLHWRVHMITYFQLKRYLKNSIQHHTFSSSFSKTEARSTIAPLTAYSICLTNGFIVSPVRILALEHFPLTREKERICTGAIKDLFLSKLDIRPEAMVCFRNYTINGDPESIMDAPNTCFGHCEHSEIFGWYVSCTVLVPKCQ